MEDIILQNTNRQNLLQLLWLRAIAICGQIITILFVNYFLKISLPLTAMFSVVLILTILSCVSFYRYKSQKNISDKSLFFELLFDVSALTTQLYFSGGISNPFISLFLLQVIISAILLRPIYAWLIGFMSIACYLWLSINFRELHAFHHHGESGDLFNLHLQGMLISYIFAAILLLIFVTKINKNLKARDQNISLLKQQSLEKEQVIRMGLLATGAAHELSTPLSTISVIINDWKEIDLSKEELKKDAKIIEVQLQRCKKIITEILSISKNDRAEQARIASAKTIFDDLINDWKIFRKPENLIYHFHSEDEKKIILDDILIQAFFNIFDNALEESPSWISINIRLTKTEVIITVKDRGKGFEQEILNKIGQPNNSAKNGNGIGLFLAVKSLQHVEGKLKIENLPNLGAKVEVIIPLKNL